MFFLFPAPPSLNDYYIVQKRGKFSVKVVSRAGVQYKRTLKQYKTLLGILTYRGDLRVTIEKAITTPTNH